MNISLIKLKPSFFTTLLPALSSSNVTTQSLLVFESLTKR